MGSISRRQRWERQHGRKIRYTLLGALWKSYRLNRTLGRYDGLRRTIYHCDEGDLFGTKGAGHWHIARPPKSTWMR